MRVFYVPPPGTEPFSWDKCGVHTIQPPDQYWKRVKEKYVIGILMHPTLNEVRKGPDGQPLKEYGVRKVWVPDEAKNKLLAAGRINPPKNYMDLDDDTLKFLGRGTFGEKAVFLKRETDIESEHRREYDELMQNNARELEMVKKQHADALRRERQALAAVEKAASTAENPGGPPAIAAGSTPKAKNQ